MIEHYHSHRLTADDNDVIGMNDQSYEQNSVSAVADDNYNVELDKLDKKARIQEAKLLKKQIVLEKDRFGVQSGELIVSPKVRDFPLRDKNGMPSMKKTIRWQ